MLFDRTRDEQLGAAGSTRSTATADTPSIPASESIDRAPATTSAPSSASMRDLQADPLARPGDDGDLSTQPELHRQLLALDTIDFCAAHQIGAGGSWSGTNAISSDE